MTNGDQTPKVGVNEENKPAGSLVTGLAALTAVLTAAGVVGGVVGRMVGESPVLFGLAVGLSLFAGLLGILAGLFTSSKSWEARLLVASNVVLFMGLLFGVVGAIQVWSNTRAPTVTATAEAAANGEFLNVTVKDSGLDSKEHVRLLVEPLHLRSEVDEAGDERRVLKPGRSIYSAWLGSDEDGDLDHTARVRLPLDLSGYVGARAYLDEPSRTCYSDPGEAEGCVAAAVPRARERLQLSAEWGERNRTLTVKLEARNIPARRIRLRALGHPRRGKSMRRELAFWRLAPDGYGSFDRSVVIPGVRRFRTVCIVASTRGHGRCPPRERTQRSAVWVRYRVPRG
jgi:hypothetical protein